ncbi:hypothetical protein AMTR_s00008p00259700 [Amborella trichopoda]|uniref:Uncharacterized protein n=1 Tax=Amborella trichopoda TaxID=13333 RepID=W1NI40_AMBTC|nr:hypothetical protein AMTR_s00008p00259700 [Amborella trichopoda]
MREVHVGESSSQHDSSHRMTLVLASGAPLPNTQPHVFADPVALASSMPDVGELTVRRMIRSGLQGGRAPGRGNLSSAEAVIEGPQKLGVRIYPEWGTSRPWMHVVLPPCDHVRRRGNVFPRSMSAPSRRRLATPVRWRNKE